jgi:hypothetical protein
MNLYNKTLSALLVLLLTVSCSKDKSSQPEEIYSSNKELLSVILVYDEIDFSTSITNTQVVNNKLFPFLAQQVKIKTFQISSGASVNINKGQILDINKSPFKVTIIAEDGSTRDYELKITKNEVLKIEPRSNIELGSSYTLQSSDVYVDGAQLTKDFDRFHISAYADFNNDGKTDVLLSSGLFKSFAFSPISLYLGNGTGVNSDYCECGGGCSGFVCNSFTKLTNALPDGYIGMQHPRKILVGDFNGDNKMDAFIIGHGYDATPFPGESPVLLINNGSGFNYKKLNSVSGFFHGGSSADFDNDGDLDIFLVGAPSDYKAIFLINDGSGNFTQTSEFIDEEFHRELNYYTSEFIDINSDGFIDLLLAGHEHEGAITYILWGNSSGKYYKDLSTALPQVSGYNIVVDIDATDIDNDGDKDILLNRVDSNSFYENYYIQIIENKGNNNFSDITTTSITKNSGSNWYLWLHLQDLNNDGKIDIYLETDHKKNLKWYNNGAGNFSQ